uniref:RNA-directed RNA polymerase n=1 Tax=Riboviria sp. TaxID=2585031 RepID=A0A514DBX6_9VIRU|nr:MAG: RNA-dependent RNA polymerase [Riboviria sp.]
MTGVEAVPSKLSHPALTVVPRLGASPHVRKYFQVVGLSLPNNYLVHNSSLNNLARGVLTRVLMVKGQPTPKPLEGVYSRRLRYFRNHVVRMFNSTTPVDRQSFVDYYSGRKRTIYQQAVDSLATSSIRRRDASIRAFVKAEFINCDEKPDPDPRVISPRDPRYNVEVGRFLRPIEHRIYGAIARIFGETTVLKGFNSQQTGAIFVKKWGKYRKPVAIGLDASRFDQHVSVDALTWEHSVYNGIYHSSELKKLLSWQLNNSVTGYTKDGKLSYVTEGCRMSGDMNTALGNCLIMCALVHCYAKERDVQISLANNGDDCTVIMEQSDLLKFQFGLQDWFLEMGFSMKVEDPVYDIEGIEFCQTHPVFVDDTYIMVRNFPKAISKDCLSLKCLDQPKICKSWMDAVGQGGLSLTGGIPVYQDFYSSFIRASGSISVPHKRQVRSARKKRQADVELTGGLAWLSAGMNRCYRPTISAKTRHSFYLAFGTTPEEQQALEAVYQHSIWSYRLENFGRLVHLPRWA